MFHGHGIIGQVALSGEARAKLLASFYDGFTLPYSPPRADGRTDLKQIGLGCFNPRHGIRAVSGGKTVDLLICFECRHVEVYENGKLIMRRDPGTDAAKLYFDRVLTQARVPLAG